MGFYDSAEIFVNSQFLLCKDWCRVLFATFFFVIATATTTFPKNVIPTVVTNLLKNIIATLLAIRFKSSRYLNDWMLKNLCIFSCTPGTT